MRINHIHIDNFLGARTIDLPLVKPITLIGAHNGAGKSSLKDAISFALVADLCRVSRKGDAASLISEGASTACVQIQADADDFEVHIAKTGKINDHTAGPAPHPALPFVLDPTRFALLNEADRRTMLFSLLGIETSHKAIGERMARRGLSAEKIAAVLPLLRAGFAAGEKHAKELASQARGAWKAATGETYGDKKAECWAPPPAPGLTGDPVVLAENAEAQARELSQQIGDLQQALGAARATQEAGQQRAIRAERLRDQAGMIERIKGRLATADENVAHCKAHLAGSGGEDLKDPASYLLRGLAASVQSLLDEAGESGVLTQLKTATRASIHLAEYRKLHGDPNTGPAGPARMAELRHALQVAESGAANARRDLAAAEAASAELTALENSQPPETPKTSDIESRLADAQRRWAEWDADARKYREAVGAADRRQQQIDNAARHHADVQQWSAIADALSPNGIQAEMIAEALEPLNVRLAEHAGLARWQPPRIGADMTITVGGRGYGLLSESERWRADALLAVTIAQITGLRLVVLDRLDCLDVTGRGDALCWLSDVAEAGQIDTAIVLATLKAAPPVQTLPQHIASHWLERGTLVVTTNEPIPEAA